MKSKRFSLKEFTLGPSSYEKYTSKLSIFEYIHECISIVLIDLNEFKEHLFSIYKTNFEIIS